MTSKLQFKAIIFGRLERHITSDFEDNELLNGTKLRAKLIDSCDQTSDRM